MAVALPQSPPAHVLGFAHLPAAFPLAVIAMVVVHLALVDFAKRLF